MRIRQLVVWSVVPLLAACADAAPPTVPTAPGSPLFQTAPGQWLSGSYSNSAGSRGYKLYVPTGYRSGTAAPLVVMLHGCTQDPEQFANGTEMNNLAETAGFLVVYPDQPSSINQNKCWQWFETAHQARGSGEPSLIAGIAGKIKGSYTIDPERVYVAGLSAGAAMSVIMGATYPDVFRAVGSASGLEYKAATSSTGAWTAMGAAGGPDPNTQGRLAYQAMGSYKRTVRTIVFHGSSDYTVYPINGHQTAEQWQQTNDYVDDGADNNSVDAVADQTVSGQVAGGRSYTRYVYNDAAGQPLTEKWIVTGMGHAWSGGSTAGSYTDPQGPKATQEMWRFFSAGALAPPSPTPLPPSGDTVAPVLTVNPAGGGSYADSVKITLSLNESGTIWCTTDGTDPATSSTRKSVSNSGTLTLKATTTVKAYGVDAAGNSSAVQTHAYTVTASGGGTAPETTVTFAAIGAEDGYTQTGTTTGTTGSTYSAGSSIYAGDYLDKARRGVLSFNTASIPDGATITSIEIRLFYSQTPYGNPWGTLGGLVADIRHGCLGMACALAAHDWEASVSLAAAAAFANPGSTLIGTQVSGSVAAAGLAYLNKTGTTQLKLRFNTNMNGNGMSDYVVFAGGDYTTAAYRPVLVVKYR